jgi:hypothetical protein
VSLDFVDEIPLTPRGKFRYVIQELDVPRGDLEGEHGRQSE